MCYSLYLFHFLVISTVARISKPWHVGNNFWIYFALQGCVILPAVLLFCGAYYLVVERPCMDKDWPRKLMHRLRVWLSVCFHPRPGAASAEDENIQESQA